MGGKPWMGGTGKDWPAPRGRWEQGAGQKHGLVRMGTCSAAARPAAFDLPPDQSSGGGAEDRAGRAVAVPIDRPP